MSSVDGPSLICREKKRQNRITVTPADHEECGQAACTDKPNMWSHTCTEDKGSLATITEQHRRLIAGEMGGNDRSPFWLIFIWTQWFIFSLRALRLLCKIIYSTCHMLKWWKYSNGSKYPVKELPQDWTVEVTSADRCCSQVDKQEWR